MIITTRERDLGGFTVRRLLPYVSRRMVGPVIFFDHMGPATFGPGQGMDVRPHPHINLATVTYLFEGRIQHKDSLGSDLPIEPGAINWMVAGKGIVHSERTPARDRVHGSTLNGIQLWVALPAENEETSPSFSHHPKDSLPEFHVGSAVVKLLLGSAFGRQSPVPVHSDLVYAEVRIPAGASFQVPSDGRECAVYVVKGAANVNGREAVKEHEMVIGLPGDALIIHATSDLHAMWIGGQPVGERIIEWNFVSSSKERIEEAKRLWLRGPDADGARFRPIPGDSDEYIPLPAVAPETKGTIL